MNGCRRICSNKTTTTPLLSLTLKTLEESHLQLKLLVSELQKRSQQLHSLIEWPSLLVRLKAYDQTTITDYANFIQQAARKMNAFSPNNSLGLEQLPYEVQRWSVLASPFVHKRAWRQFERRSYLINVQLYGLNPTVIDKLVWYVQKTLPADTHATLTRYDYLSLSKNANLK